MALDFVALRTTIISAINQAIGDDLSQTVNPETGESYGTIFKARPNPELPVPSYPYAVIDLLSISDTDWYLTNLVYDEDTDLWQYETHRTLEYQISIFGDEVMTLGDTLKSSFRRAEIIELLANGGIGIADVQQVTINPELLQTDFLEVSVVILTVRVNDIYVDENTGSIEYIILDGELTGSLSSDPLEINIDTTES